ncbi:Copper chaperone CopZ [Marinitoga hydrogenitolerans DSM 16785]|uniref:Copper chaperone CopZ n=1 Tax=Marinitoga hydrogenitolerans (strain DSM 16785 / JCM 12826 / AT1271) TaxID=1122195 RepID=A0A1M4VEC7_MARH1|nr:heavy-metal-associated domain-containing protein [Marinitoga hydrogenitolerans]SHE67336.1 Copper chaperone CopZ [Marinitoga hydrogenitolerans DSM 16785]
MKTVLLVPDMSCNHCVMRITNSLKEINIPEFEVKLDEKKVYIESSSCDIELVLRKLEEIDYPAEIVME